jgi:membrane protein implicated in regulation of membrane protease activity
MTTITGLLAIILGIVLIQNKKIEIAVLGILMLVFGIICFIIGISSLLALLQ